MGVNNGSSETRLRRKFSIMLTKMSGIHKCCGESLWRRVEQCSPATWGRPAILTKCEYRMTALRLRPSRALAIAEPKNEPLSAEIFLGARRGVTMRHDNLPLGQPSWRCIAYGVQACVRRQQGVVSSEGIWPASGPRQMPELRCSGRAGRPKINLNLSARI